MTYTETHTEARPLWWDDASYIRYQSEDPFADYDPNAWMTLLTVYSPDYCAATPVYGIHVDGCVNAPGEDCPF